MEVLLISGAVGGFYYWTLVRGRRTVRAYIYMKLLRNQNLGVVAANAVVGRIGFLQSTETALEAKAFVAEHFGGKQLALVNVARAHGFAE